MIENDANQLLQGTTSPLALVLVLRLRFVKCDFIFIKCDFI